MTLRQPRKYKRINRPCQLDSIQKINPRGWPAPCSSRLPVRDGSAGVPPALLHFEQLSLVPNVEGIRLPDGVPKRENQPADSWRHHLTDYKEVTAFESSYFTPVFYHRLVPLLCFPSVPARCGISSLPTPPSRTALPHLPTHLHCLRLSNFHREHG